MISNNGYQDRILTCRDCGTEFTFTAGEQEFYASKGLTNAPARCPGCRAARRSGQSSNPSRSSSSREQYTAVCATCGRTTTVPFLPRTDRDVYCSDCFQSQRSSRSRRDDSRPYSSYGGGRDRGRDRRDSRW